jgi:hypothetical protein
MNIDLSDNRLNSKKDIALVLIDDNQTLESNSKRIFSIFFQEKKEDYLFIKNDSITSLIHKYCFLGEILKKYNIIIFLSKIRGVVSKKPNFLLGLNIKKAKNLVTISLNKNNFLNKRLYYN